MDDGLLCYALMLPSMGVFKLTQKHNLAYECFLALAKLQSSPEDVAKALLANITMSLSGRAFHNIAVDEGLEDLQGGTKRATGAKWDPPKAMVHTALGFFFDDVRNNFGNVTEGATSNEEVKGTHVEEAHADTYAIADDLRPMRLFDFQVGAPRAFKDLKVKGQKGYLFPKDFNVPRAWLGVEHGGILNWTAQLSSSMPVFAAQLSATQEYLERMQLVPAMAMAEQSAAMQGEEEDVILYCESCLNRLGTDRVRCINPACEITCCPACICDVDGEPLCLLCAAASDAAGDDF